jgi:methylisocitrate lyase
VTARTRFRELLAGEEIIVQPVVFDALMALLARRRGFRALGLGGYQMGSHLGLSEPQLCVEDVARLAGYVTDAVDDVPVMVDAGAGFGEPLHVRHAVRVLERAGVASIHIEDQIYPKRAHYHAGIEHVIPAEAMLDKLAAALAARRDPDLAIVARCDAMRTDGYDEGVRRARLYAEAGADVVMLFPNDDDEARRLPSDVPGVPLAYVNSAGNRLGRPLYRPRELQDMGYRMVLYPIATSIAAVGAVDRMLARLADSGSLDLAAGELQAGRQLIEDTIGLDEQYALERATVEEAVV